MQEKVTQAAENTDREIWREREGDYYADSIHVTQQGGIGINCGGHVIQMPVQDWHRLASTTAQTGAVQKLVEALESIKEATSAEDDAGENYRWDDREGALDFAYATANRALAAHRESQP